MLTKRLNGVEQLERKQMLTTVMEMPSETAGPYNPGPPDDGPASFLSLWLFLSNCGGCGTGEDGEPEQPDTGEE